MKDSAFGKDRAGWGVEHDPWDKEGLQDAGAEEADGGEREQKELMQMVRLKT